MSYVLPAYNEEKLLLGALVTITAQTLPGVEYIVVDNNSSDRTRAIAAACGFTVVEEPRQGIAHARQAGLEAARGTIYASVDADTLYPPTHAGAIRNEYAKNPHLVSTGGEHVFIFTRPRIILYRQVVNRLKGHAPSQHVLRTPIGSNSTYQRKLMHEARVYTSARREEHRGIAGLITSSIERRIRTRMQALGIVDDPLKALVAKEQSLQEGRYPPIRQRWEFRDEKEKNPPRPA